MNAQLKPRVNLREATYGDLPQILAIGEEFHKESGLYRHVPYDESSLLSTLINLVESDTGALFIVEQDTIIGVVGGLLYPHYVNKNHLTGQEMFWWVWPDHRKSTVGLKLFKALEGWAKDMGAKSFMMIALEQVNPDKVGSFYMKNDYVPLEHSYMRTL